MQAQSPSNYDHLLCVFRQNVGQCESTEDFLGYPNFDFAGQRVNENGRLL